MYDVVLTRDALRSYEQADSPLVRRLNRCFDQLRRDPHEHPNIRRLRGPLAGYLRYRAGDWRVVFEVDEDRRLVTVLLIAHRSEVYK